jgi:hypothetical protein
MLWLTRWRFNVNRGAAGWRVRRFLDPGASFRPVEAADGKDARVWDTISLVASVRGLCPRAVRSSEPSPFVK